MASAPAGRTSDDDDAVSSEDFLDALGLGSCDGSSPVLLACGPSAGRILVPFLSLPVEEFSNLLELPESLAFERWDRILISIDSDDVRLFWIEA